MSYFKKNARWFVIQFVMIGIIIHSICNVCEGAENRVKVKMVLNWLANGSHAAFYAAKEKGYYEQEGLEVDILEGSGSGNAVKVVGSGAQEFGVASGESVAIGRSVGIPVVATAVFYQESPVCLFSSKKTGINKPRDLIGKKVGVKFGSSTFPMYLAMLKKANIDRSKITEISIGKGIEPLLSGDVDAMNGHIDNEPVQASMHGYPVNIIMYSSLGIKTYGISLITNESQIKEKPGIVEKFTRATLKGWEYTIANPAEAAKAVLRAKPSLKENIVTKQTMLSLDLLTSEDTLKHGCGWQTKSGWTQTVMNLKNMGQIKTDFNIEKMFTTKFLSTHKVNVQISR